MWESCRQTEESEQTVHIEKVRMRELDLQVSVAYLMCSPLQVLMKSWTWEKSVSKSGAFGMENFTNLTGRKKRVQTIRRILCNIKNIFKKNIWHVGFKWKRTASYIKKNSTCNSWFWYKKNIIFFTNTFGFLSVSFFMQGRHWLFI